MHKCLFTIYIYTALHRIFLSLNAESVSIFLDQLILKGQNSSGILSKSTLWDVHEYHYTRSKLNFGGKQIFVIANYQPTNQSIDLHYVTEDINPATIIHIIQ